jgi:hypothetical protein
VGESRSKPQGAFDRRRGTEMAKGILGGIAGLVVWVIVVTVGGLILRGAWPAYSRVAEAMTFTLPMMVARLAISVLATVAMGLVTSAVARQSSTLARVMPGVLLLVAFIPVHIALWEKFPVWYHVTFLTSLVPLTYAGGKIAARGARGALTASVS